MPVEILHRPTAMPPRAQRETANRAIAAAVASVAQEVEHLIADGHVIVGVDITCGRPTVQLMATARLAALAEAGEAAYWMRGHDQVGHYRKGQLLGRACNVVWIERGH